MPTKPRLIIPVLVILSLGLTTIWSTAQNLFGPTLQFLCLGLIFFFIFSKIDPVVLLPFGWWLYIISCLLLVATYFLADEVRGSARWLDLGFFNLQSSEAVKPLLLFFFASYLSRVDLNKLKEFLKFLALVLLPAALIKYQPDLGSALVIVAMAGVMALFSGLKTKTLVSIGLLIAIVIPIFPLLLKDYQLARIETFLNPYGDPKGKGYNVIQSVIAIGSGGVFGKGVKLGTQSHLNFLPERHTDFAFASFAEEFGFVGVFILFLAYYFLLHQLLNLTSLQKEKTHRLLAGGIFAIVFFQTVVNLGMNLGLLPVTGITLPLFSYGGSSLVVFFQILGISFHLLAYTPKYRL